MMLLIAMDEPVDHNYNMNSNNDNNNRLSGKYLLFSLSIAPK